MQLSSQIEVTLSCGRVINLENTLTYTGVSEITKLLSARRTNLNFTHLYVRYASTKSDANDVSTSFNTLNDIKSTGVSDFKTTLGTAGFSIFQSLAGLKYYLLILTSMSAMQLDLKYLFLPQI